jgi:pimeloyl-ACP methyl ester carboxylesterase
MKNPRSQAIAVDGSNLQYSDKGSGSAVFFLQAALKSPLADRLAEGFRVVTFDALASHDRQSILSALSRAAAQLGIAKYCLMAESDLAQAAISHAIGSGDSVEALILIAPSQGPNGASTDLPLEEINAPTLVLFGTRDQIVPPETGRVYARRIPRCFYTLVYDSGHDIEADCSQALYAVVRDFLQHREKFVIPHESSVINR